MHRRVVDLGLAAFLLAMTGLSVSAAGDILSGHWLDSVDVLAYAGATTLLVANCLRRPAATSEDRRWWVWLVCLGSTLSFLLFSGSTPLLPKHRPNG